MLVRISDWCWHFLFDIFFHQSEVVRPHNRQVKKWEAIFQKLSNLTSWTLENIDGGAFFFPTALILMSQVSIWSNSNTKCTDRQKFSDPPFIDSVILRLIDLLLLSWYIYSSINFHRFSFLKSCWLLTLLIIFFSKSGLIDCC